MLACLCVERKSHTSGVRSDLCCIVGETEFESGFGFFVHNHESKKVRTSHKQGKHNRKKVVTRIAREPGTSCL
jgi:hypothetical protein